MIRFFTEPPFTAILLPLVIAASIAVSGETDASEKYVQVDGIKVFYQDTGPKDGQALLFIHGWACDATFWRRQVDAFSNRYRCIVLDLPGFGRSDKPDTVAYSLSLFAKATKAVANDAGVANPVLIGHSMGYAVARQVLIEYPESAGAVVNVDGAVMLFPKDPATVETWKKGLEEFALGFTGPGREATVDMLVEGVFYGKTPENIREFVRKTMTAVDPYVCASSMAEFVKPEWWTPRIFDLPCLALYAENPMEDPALETNLREEFPGMTFMLWNDTGHFLMMEKPERFNGALADFLDNFAESTTK